MSKTYSRCNFILSYIVFSVLFLLISLLFILMIGYTPRNDTASEIGTSSQPIVIIDAGHGGEDGGTIGINGCIEKDINLNIAKKLQTFLSSMGINSVLTRETDTLLYDRNADYEGQKKRLDMKARLEIASAYENAVFISIHQNAFPQKKYSGFQIYYSANNESSLSLAKALENSVKTTLQPNNNRKAKASAGNIYLLDKLDCPALLLECGFLSNAEECELLCNEEYQNKLCAVISTEIESFLRK